MKRLIILDNGHGFDTKGKKAMMANDIMFEEWEFTRMIKLRLISILHKNGHPFHDLVPESSDVSLYNRCMRANIQYQDNKTQNPYLISLHGDAFTNKSANGVTVFTSKGQTESDRIANVFVDGLRGLGWSNRYDLDADGLKGREADFYILKNTWFPAILLELGFYTNKEQVKQMHDDIFQEKIAQMIYDSICAVDVISHA